ncbi:unnamed protein product [Amoebophrya sp. A120]|nr:unnamed protein product [Amoebophrya sp. A120]|eukprot:GSA120T00022889001.1
MTVDAISALVFQLQAAAEVIVGNLLSLCSGAEGGSGGSCVINNVSSSATAICCWDDLLGPIATVRIDYSALDSTTIFHRLGDKNYHGSTRNYNHRDYGYGVLSPAKRFFHGSDFVSRGRVMWDHRSGQQAILAPQQQQQCDWKKAWNYIHNKKMLNWPSYQNKNELATGQEVEKHQQGAWSSSSWWSENNYRDHHDQNHDIATNNDWPHKQDYNQRNYNWDASASSRWWNGTGNRTSPSAETNPKACLLLLQPIMSGRVTKAIAQRTSSKSSICEDEEEILRTNKDREKTKDEKENLKSFEIVFIHTIAQLVDFLNLVAQEMERRDEHEQRVRLQEQTRKNTRRNPPPRSGGPAELSNTEVGAEDDENNPRDLLTTICVDLEGVRLNRWGKICLLQILLNTKPDTVFVFDVSTLADLVNSRSRSCSASSCQHRGSSVAGAAPAPSSEAAPSAHQQEEARPLRSEPSAVPALMCRTTSKNPAVVLSSSPRTVYTSAANEAAASSSSSPPTSGAEVLSEGRNNVNFPLPPAGNKPEAEVDGQTGPLNATTHGTSKDHEVCDFYINFMETIKSTHRSTTCRSSTSRPQQETGHSSQPAWTLKRLFECERIEKIFFDCRNDSDAIYHQFRVKLANVLDLQILEIATRRARGLEVKWLKGLAKVLGETVLKRRDVENSQRLGGENKEQTDNAAVLMQRTQRAGDGGSSLPTGAWSAEFAEAELKTSAMLATTAGTTSSQGGDAQQAAEKDKNTTGCGTIFKGYDCQRGSTTATAVADAASPASILSSSQADEEPRLYGRGIDGKTLGSPAWSSNASSAPERTNVTSSAQEPGSVQNGRGEGGATANNAAGVVPVPTPIPAHTPATAAEVEDSLQYGLLFPSKKEQHEERRRSTRPTENKPASSSTCPEAEFLQWLDSEAKKLFEPKFGGNFRRFESRPLHPLLLLYSASDVRYMLALKEELLQKLGDETASTTATLQNSSTTITGHEEQAVHDASRDEDASASSENEKHVVANTTQKPLPATSKDRSFTDWKRLVREKSKERVEFAFAEVYQQPSKEAPVM